MKNKHRKLWLSLIISGESLVSHAGGALLVQTVRCSGLTTQLSVWLEPWRPPLAVHDPDKIVLDLDLAIALGGDATCDAGCWHVERSNPGCQPPRVPPLR